MQFIEKHLFHFTLSFSPKFNIGHNFTVDWIPLPKRLNDNSVEMYISKHSLLNIYIFVTPILQKKSCEYRRTIESGAVSGNWDTEWRVAVTLSLTLSLVISICLPAPMFQCFSRNFEICCIYCRGINFWNQVQLLSNRRRKVFWETTDFSLLLHVRFVRCWADPDHFSVLYYISPCELVLYPASGWSLLFSWMSWSILYNRHNDNFCFVHCDVTKKVLTMLHVWLKGVKCSESPKNFWTFASSVTLFVSLAPPQLSPHSHSQFHQIDTTHTINFKYMITFLLEIVIYPIWRLKPILNLYIYKTININYQSI